jgi:hypothetical protein
LTAAALFDILVSEIEKQPQGTHIMERTVFNVQFFFDGDAICGSNMQDAEVAIFFDAESWWDDDNLARILVTILSQELGEEVLLVSWGLEPTSVATVEATQL